MYIRRKVYSDTANYESVREPRYYSVIMSEDEIRMFAEAQDALTAGQKVAKFAKDNWGKAAAGAALTAAAAYGGKKLWDKRKAKKAAQLAAEEEMARADAEAAENGAED